MQNFLEKLQKINIEPRVYRNLPETNGVYIFFKKNKPIYIGKAINLKRRISSYFDVNLQKKTARMINGANYLAYVKVNSDFEALLLEAKLIRKYMPRYNIVSKDDKHPLYIRITNDKYPRIITARRISENEPNLAFYGPFPSSEKVKSVLRYIRKVFPFCDHKVGKRSCLYSQIGLCNPCPNEIEKILDESEKILARNQYLKNINKIRRLLSGKFKVVCRDLQKEMKKLSNRQKYEEACFVRDQINKLEYIIKPQTTNDDFISNPNFIEDIRVDEISELKSILKSNNLSIENISRVECYDVAHISGSMATASMVTFIKGEPIKNMYRNFRINQKKSDSDIDSLREVIARRKKHFDDWGRPDLIIVDGGKSQVGLFTKELKKNKIPIIGIAKRFEKLIIPSRKSGVICYSEYTLKHGPALNFVSRIRDEAHRFARRYHHKLLSNRIRI